MQTIFKMRDRRNTSLSISSTLSTSSTPSSTGYPAYNEKRHSSPPPPLSPTLPLPATKENFRPRTRSRLSKAWRGLVLFLALVLTWRCVSGWLGLSSNVSLTSTVTATKGSNIETGIDGPAAILTDDRSGRAKWTIAIPQNATFPLSGKQYRDICKQGNSLSARLHHDSRLGKQMDKLDRWRPRGIYYAADRSFLDIADAERSGALPLFTPSNATAGLKTCERSLTFALEATDASFGQTLLHLWLSYGLAKKEGRAFFIDDTKWAYGKYSVYFAPPPTPDCARPPSHHIVPCPHNAKHLVVSTATAPWTFSEAFHESFSLPRRHGVEKSRRVFELLRKGYEDLFKLTGEDSLYAAARIAQIKDDSEKNHGQVVGVHIRRGDLHPHEYQFAHDYIPLHRYGAEARKLFQNLVFGQRRKAGQRDISIDLDTLMSHSISSPLLLASDDPEILNVPSDLGNAAAPFVFHKAQQRIQLATKSALDQYSPSEPIREPGSAYVKHVDENAGWEGGFYSALFYALGRPRSEGLTQEILLRVSQRAPSKESQDDSQQVVSDQVMRLRELVGRAYLLDLAVLGESDGIVCGASSTACRLLGVMIGWEKMNRNVWVNVDDGRAWSWDGRR
ncbi:Hypothetical protein R9X50_00658100 [Acrodontium crateriforme]|uniref:Uncharacterized protein n=1 Tax=Acrodontium crateriforme TaxID=150365 RepID=A0AAQ3MB82_9PEZI|nr:Hypothetical protein R9X50_00658100 [Acrodontium crateriforme]